VELEDLKTQHPATYKAAMLEGGQKEHDRITVHLDLGEKFDALPPAIAAVLNGSALTPEIMGVYLSTARNKQDIRLRQEECDEAEAVFENIKPPPSSYRDEFGEAVLERLQKACWH
jgi:hypothetical protein